MHPTPPEDPTAIPQLTPYHQPPHVPPTDSPPKSSNSLTIAAVGLIDEFVQMLLFNNNIPSSEITLHGSSNCLQFSIAIQKSPHDEALH